MALYITKPCYAQLRCDAIISLQNTPSKYIGNSPADVPYKFQSDVMIASNHPVSGLYDILR